MLSQHYGLDVGQDASLCDGHAAQRFSSSFLRTASCRWRKMMHVLLTRVPRVYFPRPDSEPGARGDERGFYISGARLCPEPANGMKAPCSPGVPLIALRRGALQLFQSGKPWKVTSFAVGPRSWVAGTQSTALSACAGTGPEMTEAREPHEALC